MKKAAVIISLVLMTLGVSAQEKFAVAVGENELWFEVIGESGEVRLTYPAKDWPYYSRCKPNGRVAVPSEVKRGGKRYKVVEVGDNAFYRCDSVVEVLLPEGCRRIGAQAFCGCERLQRVMWNEALEEVGEGAFAYCKGMREVRLPQKVSRVGLSAFAMCEGLEFVEMSETAWRTCNDLTFWGCKRMKSGKK
ncbi:MAG: leucine-rich repeat domain-containing protein [Bacteroidales bacterium]|nr:leucine-rich repeat domain-containing protein [Bacteroidales bacterium]